jgi:hypothetical protein
MKFSPSTPQRRPILSKRIASGEAIPSGEGERRAPPLFGGIRVNIVMRSQKTPLPTAEEIRAAQLPHNKMSLWEVKKLF